MGECRCDLVMHVWACKCVCVGGGGWVYVCITIVCRRLNLHWRSREIEALQPSLSLTLTATNPVAFHLLLTTTKLCTLKLRYGQPASSSHEHTHA